MLRLDPFTLRDMIACRTALKEASADAGSMEVAAQRLVAMFHDELRDADGARATVLVRLYKTHPFGELDPDLQRFARECPGGEEAGDDTRCLTLLASRGVEEEWCSRHRSQGHRAIPLPSPRSVERFPMIAQLVHQLGVDIAAVVAPDSAILVAELERTFNVFHVPVAAGSPHIPDQESFVAPYGVASALGYGGMLPSGDLFTVILFTTVRVERSSAELFRPLALSTKLALLPYSDGPIFAPS
jgi:two-component system, NtrC family, sensor kinase